MPEKLARACSHWGCGHVSPCPVHSKADLSARWKQDGERRKDQRKFYWSERWRRTRKAILRKEPICRDCKGQGFVRAAVEVHHEVDPRDAPELAYDSTNLVPLCKSHHSKRTRHGQTAKATA